MCDKNDPYLCIDKNNEPLYTHTEDNCKRENIMGIKNFDLNYCEMGKLWRKKHNMDYKVNEDDSHLVTVGDKKLFTKENCAYFLNTGKIKGIDIVPTGNNMNTGNVDYRSIYSDINHTNFPPRGKEWKAVKWTCTEDCNDKNPMGTCHAYTEIIKSNLNKDQLKSTENNACTCKHKYNSGTGLYSNLSKVYPKACRIYENGYKSCKKDIMKKNKAVDIFIKENAVTDNIILSKKEDPGNCNTSNVCKYCKPFKTPEINEMANVLEKEGKDTNEINYLRNLTCGDFVNEYDTLDQFYEDCKYILSDETTNENDINFICESIANDAETLCSKCFEEHDN